MAAEPTETQIAPDSREQKRQEWRMFLFIVIFLFPIFTVALVGAYGFSIWMYQLLMGPPTGG